jgi:hypothetical protein
VSRGGRDTRVVPNAFVTSRSRWAATSKSSRIRRFSRSRPPSTGAGPFSACVCANECFFFPLLDAPSSPMSSSASSPRCRWTAAYPSYNASPESRRNRETNAGLVACGEGDVMRLSVDELVEPELELPLLTVIRPLCRCDIRFWFCFGSYSSILLKRSAPVGRGEEGKRGVPVHGVAKQTT